MILNRVASDGHFRMLEAAILSACKTPILGWLPREPDIAIPERHLGLHTMEESNGHDSPHGNTEKLIEALGQLGGKVSRSRTSAGAPMRNRSAF